jgi:sugar phosphate isomerase/epimerase
MSATSSVKRRGFIAMAGGAVAAMAAALDHRSLAIGAAGGRSAVGLELITVMSLLDDDFRGTLSEVSAIGYREVETLGSMGRSPAEVRDVLRACHLDSPSQHLVPGDLYAVYQQWNRGAITMAQALESLEAGYALARMLPIIEEGIERARTLGQRYLVWPVLFASQVASAQALDEVIRALNLAGDLCRREGLTFAYHNGSNAFRRIGTDLAYDLILRHTDRHAVKMELDTYYAVAAGADVPGYFAHFPGRFRLMHLKDLDRQGQITALGKGTIDFHAVMHAAKAAGVQHLFVEQDRAPDALASARSSFEYVRSL